MATNSDQVTPTSHNSARSDSQVTLQPSSITAHDSCEDHPQSSIAVAECPAFQWVMSSGSSCLDSGFDSLHQPNSFNYEADFGDLPSNGAGCLPSLEMEGGIDDAYESLQPLPSMGDHAQFLSMGDFSMMDSFSSMGSTVGEFPYLSQLPVITESPPSSNEIESTDPQAGPDSTHVTQGTMGDGSSNPSNNWTDSDPNENIGQVEHVVLKNGCNSDENAEMDIQGHNPMRNEESVSNPQLPSTLLSNVRSQPIEIPLREPVKQKPDYVLERVLVEEKVHSV